MRSIWGQLDTEIVRQTHANRLSPLCRSYSTGLQHVDMFPSQMEIFKRTQTVFEKDLGLRADSKTKEKRNEDIAYPPFFRFLDG